jgi:hypothetical protein
VHGPTKTGRTHLEIFIDRLSLSNIRLISWDVVRGAEAWSLFGVSECSAIDAMLSPS